MNEYSAIFSKIEIKYKFNKRKQYLYIFNKRVTRYNCNNINFHRHKYVYDKEKKMSYIFSK